MGSITGAVTATTSGAPLGSVAIAVSPGTLTTTTAADGTFSFKDVPIGAYTLTFKRAGYVDKTVSGVGVAMMGPTNVAVSLDTNAAVGGPTVVVSDNLLAGFKQSVTVTAQVTPSADEDAAALTYSWAQTGGVKATFTGGNTNAITFTTLAIADAKPDLTARFGALGFNPDQTGNYAFTLTVTDPQGHATTATAHVTATWAAPGLANVAVGLPAWFQGDAARADGSKRTAWSWTLDVSGASGSTAKLIDPATNAACAVPCTAQFPSFTPDKIGTYVLTETDAALTGDAGAAAKKVTVHAGTWLGVMDSSTSQITTCQGCHNDQPLPGGTVPVPDKFTPWRNTAHYSALHRKLDGQATSHFSDNCMSCHSVGDSPLASNGGWDDVAKQVSWSFPAKLQSGNWDNLVSTQPALAQLGSIQCESCHGPQNTGAHPADKDSRISYSSDVCASCHQEDPLHYNPEQWSTSAHADKTLALLEATVEGRGTTAAHCGRCHSAQGYVRYSKQLLAGNIGLLTKDGKVAGATNAADVPWLRSIGLTAAEVESQTCQSCHDPHANPNPVASIDCSTQSNNGNPACAQLRVYDAIPGLPNGQGAISGVGAGAVCMSCHNTRNGEHSDFVAAPTAYTAPHTPSQTDTLYGFNAYFVPRNTPSPHLAVKDTCAGCHVGVPTAAQQAAHQSGNHSFTADLTICSSCHGTSGVDGAALQAAVQTQLDALGALIDAKVLKLINAAITANGSYLAQAWDPVSDYYSSTGAANVVLTVAPTAIAHEEIHGQTGYILTLATPVTVPWVDASGAAKGSTSITQIHVQAGKLQTGSSPAPLYPANSVLNKAEWNWHLLNGDGTLGIHNLPFYNQVLSASYAQVNAL